MRVDSLIGGRLCRQRSPGRVLTPGPALSCVAGNSGVRSTGEARGFPSHPGITGEGQAGRMNCVNLR